MNINKYVGEKIKIFREKKNITQEELAQQLSVSRQTISRYESGERRIKQDAIFTIADYLGVSVNDLFPPISEEVKQELDDDMTQVYNDENVQLFIKGEPTKEKIQEALDYLYEYKKTQK